MQNQEDVVFTIDEIGLHLNYQEMDGCDICQHCFLVHKLRVRQAQKIESDKSQDCNDKKRGIHEPNEN